MADDEIQPEVDDIAADIRNAAEEVATKNLGDKPAREVPDDKSTDTEPSGERLRGPDGKFVSKTVEREDPAAPAEITDADRPREQPQPQSNALTPPTSWSADAKAPWSTLPPAVQQAVAKREAEMADGQRQWSEQRQQLERDLTPLHELSQQNGIPWKEGLNRLLNVEAGLRNPATAAQTVQQIASAYGVDLRALVNGSPQPQRSAPAIDPNQIIQQVRREVAETYKAQQQDYALNSEIERFTSERSADGQPAHPHFDSVKGLMGHLLASGQATGLQDAYDKAIWVNADTRPRSAPQPQAQQQAQQVLKSKKAAVSVSGAPSGAVTKVNGFDPKQSLDDDIREAMAMVRR